MADWNGPPKSFNCKLAIGIDLGTSNSSVGVWQDGRVVIIPNDLGHRTTPSYISFTEEGKLVGEAAKSQVATNPMNTVWGFKCLMGRAFADPVVQEGMKRWPFKIVSIWGKPIVEVDRKGETKRFTPEELSSIMLLKLKHTAEAYLCQAVTAAVITVPATFNRCQVAATKNAAVLAGFNDLRMISDNNAATVAYIDHTFTLGGGGRKNLLFLNISGATLCATIVSVEDGLLGVRGISRDANIGGEHFDNQMVNHFCQEYKSLHNDDISGHPGALQKLRVECENAKKVLSSGITATIKLDEFYTGTQYHTTITRSRFEDLCKNHFRASLVHVANALRNAHMDKSDIDEVILVGGSTHIPKIQNLLQDFFGGKELIKSFNKDETPAYGAALHAALRTEPRDSRVNPINLFAATPWSLGVETFNGAMTILIKKCMTVPFHVIQTCTTVYDNQSAVIISIYEGEGALVKDNNLLGIYFLSEIPAAPAGVPQIELTLSIDVDETLKMKAVDKSTGREKLHTIVEGSQDLQSREEMCKILCSAQGVNREEVAKFRAFRDAYASINRGYESLRGLCSRGQGNKELFDEKLEALCWEEEQNHFMMNLFALGIQESSEGSVEPIDALAEENISGGNSDNDA